MESLAQRWQRLSKRQQAAAFVAGALAGLWIVNVVALRPLRRRLDRLHDEVQQAEQRLVEALVASQQATRVNKTFEAYASYVQPSGPPESELASVLSEVESAVRQSGMVLLNLKPVTPRDGTVEAISVTVDGEADPEQLMNLLDRIQRSTRLLKVTELSVRVSEQQRLRTSLVISKLLLK
jgi:type II secretory pathway component PulM